MEAKHSELPWFISQRVKGLTAFIDSGNRTVCQMTGKNSEANAAFIVRACNAHEALVGALEAVLAQLITHGIWPERQDKIRAALALVREG